jgi:HEAT repeat protein
MGLIALLVSATVSGSACAQVGAQGDALDRRVSAVGDGQVELHFDARADVCGDGTSWYRMGSNNWYGTYTQFNDGPSRGECTAGPVRVLATVIGREVVRLQAFVGPLQHRPEATDLGAVSDREATAWLLSLGQRLDGRAARDAIAAAVLAKDGAGADGFLRVARDEDRSRETRRAALSALGRINSDAGVLALLQLADRREDVWLATEATRALGRSGDPRARAWARTVVGDSKRSDEQRAAAIATLASDPVSGADATMLRESYRGFTTQKQKEAVLSALASIGGRTNAEWLMRVASDDNELPTVRRRAVSLAERAGADGAALSALYDRVSDTETRGAVISALSQEGSRPAREKLMTIAKSTETPTTRRRAIAALEKFDSAEVNELLTSLALPRP